MSAALLGPLGLCADALDAHASYPPGREIRLPASRTDADELQSTPGAASAIRSHYRMAEHAKALGMSQKQFRAARRAGTLPPALMKRHPRSDKGGSRA
jgi:hypothetical protein